ncbi:MAG: TonB-dependent receptor [Cyclobacteriaceae bacterium]|nr:TonB-dependent receptor [Cyclobacteriaceae bacterium]
MKFFYTLLSIFLICFSAYSQHKSDTIKASYLDEVVISANKIGEPRRLVAQQVEVINSTTINNLNAQTSADLIQNSGQVAMQRSQQGGGSPIIRGFEASRVLLVIDGVRMNNAIYRSGHLQNIITMDNNVLERAEILFGPSSTVYGSDALGGVVHFFTRNPTLATNAGIDISGNTFVRFGSANHEKTAHFDFNIGGKRFASLSSFTLSDFGDLRMGEKTNQSLGEEYWVRYQYAERAPDNSGDVLVQNSDPYVQKFSGYKQYDLLQKFYFKQNNRIQHQLNFQYSTSSNLPRYDRLTDAQGTGLRSAEWYYGPQQRLLISYQLKLTDLGKLADALTTTVSYQNIEESRNDRRFNSNNLNHRIEKINVGGLTIDLQKKIKANQLRYGFDGQSNSLTSSAYRENISSGGISPLDTRYPDGDNTLNYWALYATHTLPLNDTWTLTDGIRVGGSSLHSTFVDKTFFPFPYDDIKQNNTYASGNLGIIYSPTSWKFSFMMSTGYRVPNIDDLAKVFESVQGSASTTGMLVIPNPDLVPEKTTNADLSITKFFGAKSRLEGVLFATNFFDAIATRPSTLNGQSAVLYNGYPANVVSSQNVGEAYIYGYSVSGHFELIDHLTLTASFNYTHGRIKNEDAPETPLDHIPPTFGRIGINYSKTKFSAELFSNFNGWKRVSNYSSSGEDNLQYATSEGMPSWYTLNLRTSYMLNKVVTFQAGIDNLMDLQYRQFASGINSPGRNIFGTLRIRF